MDFLFLLKKQLFDEQNCCQFSVNQLINWLFHLYKYIKYIKIYLKILNKQNIWKCLFYHNL